MGLWDLGIDGFRAGRWNPGMEDSARVSKEAFDDLLLVASLLKAELVAVTRALGEVARLSNVGLDVPTWVEEGRLAAVREALARAEGTDPQLAARLRNYLIEEHGG